MMRVYVDDYKLVIPKAWPETIRFNFITKADNSLKHEIDSIIRRTEFLVKQIIKAILKDYCSNINMETIFMITGNGKPNEPHKYVLDLSQRLNLRCPDISVTLQNL